MQLRATHLRVDGRSASLIIAMAMLGVLAMQPLSAALTARTNVAADDDVPTMLINLSRGI